MEGPADAVVVLLWPDDLPLLAASKSVLGALEAASESEAPVLVVPFDGALVPSAARLAGPLRRLADAPITDPDDLPLVLDALRPEPPLVPVPARPTAVKRRRRDPILLRTAVASGAIGFALWATLGFGAASLFLFLGAVSLAVSRQDEE